MPKKRKKDRKQSKPRNPVRSVPSGVGSAQPELPEWDTELDWDTEDDEGFEWLGSLRSRFPLPDDAVAAARAGEMVEWTGNIDGGMMRHRVLLADDGTASVEQAVFIDVVQEHTLICAWHQTPAPERQAMQTQVLAALDELHAALRPVLETKIRAHQPSYTAPVPESFHEDPEPHGPGLPLFGWRIIHPVSGETTWEETVDVATWNTSLAMSGWLGEYDHIVELKQVGFVRLLQRHKVSAVLCSGCDLPLTDRHPRWPGIWTTPTEVGPSCDAGGTGTSPEPRFGSLTDRDFGAPHRPESELPVAQG
ncbi:hypothetical protein ACOKM5_43530 [Streptomyces sp. BH097]|uniref:hypothetical protein n=1 Tax=unclassified Streptomyces TaxID=2593676 RepID=UPI003BB6237A